MTSQTEQDGNTPGTHRIVQGHPTYAEPDANKGGQNGAPKPDGRSAEATEALTDGGADAGASQDDPGRGAD